MTTAREHEPVPESVVPQVSSYLRAIAHATRLRLVEHLGEGDATARDLACRVGLSDSNVTRHLQALYALGVANRTLRRGRFVYSLADQTALELLDRVAAHFVDG